MSRALSTAEANPKAFEITREDDASAREFLSKHIAFDEIVEEERPRIDGIFKLLRDIGAELEVSKAEVSKEIIEALKGVGINKHDLPHELRTAYNVVNVMRGLRFSHREIVLAAAAAMVHDIAYNKLRPENMKNPGDAKGGFHNHAADGADELKDRLSRALTIVQRRVGGHSEIIKKIRRQLTYKDENLEDCLITEEDIDDMWGAIFHHNDYGKDEAGYNPYLVKKMMLVVQLCDKLDICQQRVYPEHMKREDFVPTEEREDGTEREPNYAHRSVPYCITDYRLVINEQNERMTWVANVDLNRFNEFMGTDFYDPESFADDFNKAYESSARVAAEAFGVITHEFDRKKSIKDQTSNLDGHNALKVELRFENGNVEKLYYKRPEREIYTSTTIAPWQQKLSAIQAAQEMHLMKDEGEAEAITSSKRPAAKLKAV